MCVYYVLRPVLVTDRDRVRSWTGIPAELDWTIEQDGDDVALSLHGCDFIRDWERQSGWKLPRKLRSQLHRDLAALLQEMSGQVEVTATWTGDEIEHEAGLSRTQVLDLVLANQLENRTLYRVTN